MTGDVIVFGAAYSVYVRIVRLALEEKGVPYRLVARSVSADRGGVQRGKAGINQRTSDYSLYSGGCRRPST